MARYSCGTSTLVASCRPSRTRRRRVSLSSFMGRGRRTYCGCAQSGQCLFSQPWCILGGRLGLGPTTLTPTMTLTLP